MEITGGGMCESPAHLNCFFPATLELLPAVSERLTLPAAMT